MPIYRWICPLCDSAYILPRQSKHQYNHWRCYTCHKVFHKPRKIGTMMWSDHFEAPLSAKKPSDWKQLVSKYAGPYQFPKSMMMYPETPAVRGQKIARKTFSKKSTKRRRATVVAEQDGQYLIVRERGAKRWSLPGGGIESGESELRAAIRELEEEARLKPTKAEYLFRHEGTTQQHRVVRISVSGKVHLQKKELAAFKWWDGTEDLPMLDSARAILKRATGLPTA